MEFYFGILDDIKVNINDHLYVVLDNNYKHNISRKNIVIPYDCIFSFNYEDELTYYNIVANKMKNAGFNGFMNWVTECINNFSNYMYHDDNDKPIMYKSIIFVSNNDTQKKYVKNIFNNFGFDIKDYNIKLKNVLF